MCIMISAYTYQQWRARCAPRVRRSAHPSSQRSVSLNNAGTYRKPQECGCMGSMNVVLANAVLASAEYDIEQAIAIVGIAPLAIPD